MKQKFFFSLFIMAMAIVGLTGCSDDTGVTPPDTIEEGLPTTMTVSILLPGAATETRAGNDVNAVAAEQRITSADILIYESGGNFLARHTLSPADFTYTSSTTEVKITANAEIATTTGQKHIFAGLNLPSAVATSLDNRHMSELGGGSSGAAIQQMTISQLTDTVIGLPMFSYQAVSPVLEANKAAPANQIKIDVKRLVGKIAVESSATMIQDGTAGKLGPLEYTVAKFNRRQYLLPGLNNADPNWLTNSYDAGEFEDFITAVPTPYRNVLSLETTPIPAIDDYEVLYAAENTSESKRKKEITRLTVRATFVPATITTGSSLTEFTEIANPNPSTVATFWAITPAMGEAPRYFMDQTIANDFAQANSIPDDQIITYTGGYGYWDIFLNKTSDTNKWDVVRNEFYKCKITRIVTPGRNIPDLRTNEEEETPDSDTAITVEVHVAPWSLVEDNYELIM